MGNSRDLEDYMHELLDASNPRVKVFINELLSRWRQLQCSNSVNKDGDVSITV